MINILKSDFERSLLASSIFSQSPQLNISDLKELMKGFQDKKTPTSIRSIFQKFFMAIPNKISFRVKLKILATCNVLLDDFLHGTIFSEYLNEWEGFSDNEPFIQLYYQILQRFSQSISIIKIAKSQKSFPLKQFPENQNMYYKAINLMNYVFSQTNIIINAEQTDKLVSEIELLIWNDLIALYIFFEKLMIEFSQDFSIIQTSIFFIVYSLLSDFMKLTQQIKKFYHLVDNKQVIEPIWKIIPEKKLDDINKYNQTIKITTTRHKMQIKKRQQTLTPQNGPQLTQQFFSNTTMGYFKRLSTQEDPFEMSSNDNIMTQF